MGAARTDDGVAAVAGPDAVWLRTPVPLTGQEKTTVADFTVRAGDRVPFAMTWSPSYKRAPPRLDAEHCLAETEAFWTEWSSRSHVRGRYRDAIQRSLIVLKALTFAPTGGIVAAATTSLPEQLGGPRNWDYRYCWLRDSTYTLQALLAAGYVAEAKAWREWLLRAVAGDPSQLQIMYGLDGSRRLPEYELPLAVRVRGLRAGTGRQRRRRPAAAGRLGRGARRAVPGPRGRAGRRTTDAWDLQVALLDFLEGAWQQPDNGLWEMRGPRRHFVHSKVMAWVAFDRMVRAHRARTPRHGLPGDVDLWEARRDEIHADVCANGFNAGEEHASRSPTAAPSWTRACC